MQPLEIQTLIESTLADTTASVSSTDNIHFDAVITSPLFAGKTRVQQQQMIYQILNPYIASGEIHAIGLKTRLPNES